ncbi:unnamed protein product [Blepharisma stoltei]|uniref:Uncharacterized protein n=1 Tax=Blepharisma stoltei TaxID=1481888 RepID=A0AAU9KAE6_9CILI|nr:unnamed protein product [Blepharisma stoltei]
MKRPINILTFTQKEEPLSLTEIKPISLIAKELSLPEPLTEIDQADSQALSFEERKKYTESAMVWLRTLFLKRKHLKDHPSYMLDQTNQFANILCDWIIYSLKSDKRTQAFSLIGVLDKLIDPKSKLKFKDRSTLRGCLQIYTGAYYLKEKKNDQAIEACEKAIALTEKNNAFQELVLALSICGYAICMSEDHKRALDLHQRALDLLSNKCRFENDKVNIYITVCLYNTAIECVHMNMREEAQSYIMQAYNIAQVNLKALPLVHTKVLWLYKELKDQSPQRPDALPKIEKQNALISSSDSGKMQKSTKDPIKISPSKALPPHPLFKMLHSSAQENKNQRPGTSSGPGEKRIGRDLLISNDKKPRPVSANKQDLIDLEKTNAISNDKPALSLKEKIRIRSKKEKSRTRIEPAKKNVVENIGTIKVRNNAAKKIQKKWRLHFSEKILKIIKIQNWYRRYKNQQKLARLKRSIILIQSIIRRKEVFLKVRGIKSLNKNILSIQKSYRGHKDYLKFKMLKNSIMIIQAVFKRKDAFMSVQEMKNDYKDKNMKVLDIQRCYRGYRDREKKKKLEYALLALQALYRRKEAIWAVQEIRKVRDNEEEQKVIKIQKCYRGYKQRKITKRIADLILILQSLLRRKEAILTIKNLKSEVYNGNREVILKIQKIYKGYKERKRVKNLKNSILIIQSLLRAKSAYSETKEMKQKVILTQSVVKALLVKKKYKHCRDGIIKIQSSWRRFITQKQISSKNASISKIKAFLLGIIIRKQLAKKNQSAIKIQSWYKSLIVQRKLSPCQRFLKKFILKLILGICKELKKDAKEFLCIKIGQKEKAAIKIQSQWRKCIWKARAEIIKLSQNKVKGFLLGIIARKRLRKQKVAAIKIQSWIKGFLYRKNARKVQRLKRLH